MNDDFKFFEPANSDLDRFFCPSIRMLPNEYCIEFERLFMYISICTTPLQTVPSLERASRDKGFVFSPLYEETFLQNCRHV